MRRRAAIIVELLLAMPVLVMGLLAALEFGVMMSNFQQIALASRNGALAASETMNLDTAVNVPPNVVDVVDRQLGSANMTPCRIRLEHNVGGPQAELLEPAVGGCDCGPAMFVAPVPTRPYVQVTVCVDMTQVAPNCLKNFGFDLTGQVAEFTTLMRHEMPIP
ncbi:MAG: pilus assembly protein [Pirellulaceae bacterium]